MSMRDLLGKLARIDESMKSAEKKPTGPKFGAGKWKGTDSAAQAKNKYVGNAEESIIKDLEKALVENPRTNAHSLMREFKEFKESDCDAQVKKAAELAMIYNQSANLQSMMSVEEFIFKKMGIRLDTIVENFNSKQEVINHFVKQGKPAGAGAAAWERGWRGPKVKTPNTTAPKAPQTQQKYWWQDKEDLNEFSITGDDDRDNDPEEALFRFAKLWYSAPDVATQQQVEKALAQVGWEIGEIESEEGGAFVMRIGDEHGDSYLAWSEEHLVSEGLNEYGGTGGYGAASQAPQGDTNQQPDPAAAQAKTDAQQIQKSTGAIAGQLNQQGAAQSLNKVKFSDTMTKLDAQPNTDLSAVELKQLEPLAVATSKALQNPQTAQQMKQLISKSDTVDKQKEQKVKQQQQQVGTNPPADAQEPQSTNAPQASAGQTK